MSESESSDDCSRSMHSSSSADSTEQRHRTRSQRLASERQTSFPKTTLDSLAYLADSPEEKCDEDKGGQDSPIIVEDENAKSSPTQLKSLGEQLAEALRQKEEYESQLKQLADEKAARAAHNKEKREAKKLRNANPAVLAAKAIAAETAATDKSAGRGEKRERKGRIVTASDSEITGNPVTQSLRVERSVSPATITRSLASPVGQISKAVARSPAERQPSSPLHLLYQRLRADNKNQARLVPPRNPDLTQVLAPATQKLIAQSIAQYNYCVRKGSARENFHVTPDRVEYQLRVLNYTQLPLPANALAHADFTWEQVASGAVVQSWFSQNNLQLGLLRHVQSQNAAGRYTATVRDFIELAVTLQTRLLELLRKFQTPRAELQESPKLSEKEVNDVVDHLYCGEEVLHRIKLLYCDSL